MNQKTKDNIKKHMMPHIHTVISKKYNSWHWVNKDLHYPLGDIVAVLEEEGFEIVTPVNTNGWQWDYSLVVIKDEKRYVLSGSGYYGGHKFYCEEK